MHTVVTELCSGCDLCVLPCPVDCIDMVPAPGADATWGRARADAAPERFEQRGARLERERRGRAARLAARGPQGNEEPDGGTKGPLHPTARERGPARRES